MRNFVVLFIGYKIKYVFTFKSADGCREYFFPWLNVDKFLLKELRYAFIFLEIFFFIDSHLSFVKILWAIGKIFRGLAKDLLNKEVNPGRQ